MTMELCCLVCGRLTEADYKPIDPKPGDDPGGLIDDVVLCTECFGRTSGTCHTCGRALSLDDAARSASAWFLAEEAPGDWHMACATCRKGA